MTNTYYLDPDGKRYDSLPHKWNNASPITEEYALSHGWTKHTETIPEPSVITVTKYSLLVCLRANHAELYDTLKAAYDASADLRFFWNSVNELNRLNEDFINAYTSLGLTAEQVEAIFNECQPAEEA